MTDIALMYLPEGRDKKLTDRIGTQATGKTATLHVSPPSFLDLAGKVLLAFPLSAAHGQDVFPGHERGLVQWLFPGCGTPFNKKLGWPSPGKDFSLQTRIEREGVCARVFNV